MQAAEKSSLGHHRRAYQQPPHQGRSWRGDGGVMAWSMRRHCTGIITGSPAFFQLSDERSLGRPWRPLASLRSGKPPRRWSDHFGHCVRLAAEFIIPIVFTGVARHWLAGHYRPHSMLADRVLPTCCGSCWRASWRRPRSSSRSRVPWKVPRPKVCRGRERAKARSMPRPKAVMAGPASSWHAAEPAQAHHTTATLGKRPSDARRNGHVSRVS
jgi:hypothetical protein